MLGIEMDLRGTISFSRKAVTRYLLPVLASDTFGPDSSPIKLKALSLLDVQSGIDDAQQSRELGNGPDGMERLKERHRELEEDLMEALFERFQNQAPRHVGHPLLALATFEKLARSSLDRKQLAASFIERMGIGDASASPGVFEERRTFAGRQATLLVQNKYVSSPESSIGHMGN